MKMSSLTCDGVKIGDFEYRGSDTMSTWGRFHPNENFHHLKCTFEKISGFRAALDDESTSEMEYDEIDKSLEALEAEIENKSFFLEGEKIWSLTLNEEFDFEFKFD